MIYLSIGIAMLAIGSMWIAHHQFEEALDKSYAKGFRDGAKCIVERKYKRIDEVMGNEKD
jgi:hypothetical protein